MRTALMLSEDELDRRYQTKSRLASGGDYGCGCAVFEGDLVAEGDEMLFCDEWFYALSRQHPHDVGTLLVTGDVRSKRELYISDRLMCLVVLGSLEAPALSVFETEMLVGGDLSVGELSDRDNYLTVQGKRVVGASA